MLALRSVYLGLARVYGICSGKKKKDSGKKKKDSDEKKKDSDEKKKDSDEKKKDSDEKTCDLIVKQHSESVQCT